MSATRGVLSRKLVRRRREHDCPSGHVAGQALPTEAARERGMGARMVAFLESFRLAPPSGGLGVWVYAQCRGGARV